MSSRTAAWWLGAICLLALGLRLFGLAYGLPDVHNPDEIPILNRALDLANHRLNPHNFLYPTLYFYALLAWEGLFFLIGRVTGFYGSLAAFERDFFVDPSHLVLAGRALTAMFGVLTIVAVYQLGARLYDRMTGLGAALLLAVAPFAVRDAHYIKHDVPVTFFIVLTQVAAARIVVDPSVALRRRSWLLAGAMSGLALSTQYYAFPVVLVIIAAAAIEAGRIGRWRAFVNLVWAGVGSIAAFLATTPFFLLEFKTVVRDMVAVRQIDMDRAVTGAGAFSSAWPYLHMIATDAIGWSVALAAIVGAVLALARDRARAAVLLCFPIGFLVFLANTTPMNRYLNPMLPSLALAAAVAISRMADAFGRRAPVAAGLLCAATALPGFFGSLRSDQFFRQADTRTLAREFIERTAPEGSTVLVQPHGVQLRTSRDALVEALRTHLGSESRATIKFQKQLGAASSVAPAYRVLYLGRVTDGGLDVDKIYVPPSAFGAGAGLEPLRQLHVGRVALEYNASDLARAPLQSALERDGHLEATFSPYREDAGVDRRAAAPPFFHNTAARIDSALERPGPIVQIWRID